MNKSNQKDTDVVTVGLLQMNGQCDWRSNQAFISSQLANLQPGSLDWLVLPEYFPIMGRRERDKLPLVEEMGDGPIQTQLKAWARRLNVWLFAGSMPIASPDPERPFGRCLVIDSLGETVAHYDKIHLFDVSVDDAHQNYRESKGTMAGDYPTLVETPHGRVGLAICYDLRFPELFQFYRQAGADFVVLPSAFTHKTGEAHWQTLLQARAIENQMFILAAAQAGEHENGRQTWGHTMAVDCWGRIVGELEHQPGLLTVRLPLKQLGQIRHAMPVCQHRRFPKIQPPR